MVYYDKYVAEREMAKSGVGWFKFDGVGGNVTDSKGTAVGTVTGTTRVTGVSGNAISFNGTGDYIQFASNVIPIGKKSIRFKIKTPTSTVGQMVTTQTRGSLDHGTQIFINADGTINFAIAKGTSGSTIFAINSNKTVTDNQWHDVLFTWDGTTSVDGVKIYVDDMKTPDTTGTASMLQTVTPTYTLRFGRSQAAGDSFWLKGQIDELEIYSDVIDTTSNKSFILKENNYYKYLNGEWIIVSSTTPTLTQFQGEGMNELPIIDGDFEVVTWSNAIDEIEGKVLNVNGIPVPQFIYINNPIRLYGKLEDLIVSEGINNGVQNNTRYLISPNKTTWYTWNGTSYVPVDISNKINIFNDGLTLDTINSMSAMDWNSWNFPELYVGIYLDDDIDNTGVSLVDSITGKDSISKYTTKISDAKLYILNTLSTINVTFAGKTVTGEVDDADSGKVQYRVLLNGVPYFPLSGEFTPLQPAPMNVALTLSNEEIKIDENNVLRIEFQDYWGSADYWETNFVGTYNGLMFLDATGEYYSTDVGEILQYLDFGIIIAGQTTIEQAIVLRNTYGYPVDNILIRSNQSNFPTGMSAKFGTNEISFESLDQLLYAQTLEDGEELTFYIRLATQLGVTPPTSGEFDIIVTADKVI